MAALSSALDRLPERLRHALTLDWSAVAGDLAGAYAYLASEESRWTTGAAIVVDGGYSAP